jgi:hypothetical protein
MMKAGYKKKQVSLASCFMRVEDEYLYVDYCVYHVMFGIVHMP